MTNLRLKPKYAHAVAEVVFPPKTNLTRETAFPYYEKLKNFLGFMIESDPPAWWGDGKDRRDLFQEKGFHHPVRWKPNLPTGWRRLQFDEFCVWYGIKI